MAYFKKKDHLTRTIFSNTFEPPFVDSTKKFYAYLTKDGKSYMYKYTTKFRNEAITFFEELARLSDAKFDGKLYAIKN